MLESYQLQNVIWSFAAGAIVGLAIAFGLKWPRSKVAFAISLVVNFLCPWIGRTTYLINDSDRFIIHLNLFLVAMLAAMNMMFLIRYYRKAVRAGV